MPFADAMGRRRALLSLLLALAACGGTLDDLFPSGADRRTAGAPGSVGQVAPDFTLTDTLGNPVDLYATLSSARGAVLYFTMWCPICDAHMSHLQANAIPAFPDVRFFAVDYVSGSAAEARAAQVASGWDPTAFTVLADVGARVEGFYAAPMEIVIIGRDRTVLMNGEYDWARVQSILASLP
jgi:peroxiredoxin